jgi:hypothetical protein
MTMMVKVYNDDDDDDKQQQQQQHLESTTSNELKVLSSSSASSTVSNTINNIIKSRSYALYSIILVSFVFIFVFIILFFNSSVPILVQNGFSTFKNKKSNTTTTRITTNHSAVDTAGNHILQCNTTSSSLSTSTGTWY